jgi:undecaprenyl-diphosphatase
MALALVAGAVWAVLRLAEFALAGQTRWIDEALLLALRHPADPTVPLGPHWLRELGRDVTALGSNGILILLSAAVAGLLLLKQRARTALIAVLAVSSGMLLSHMLKLGFDRPRPDLVPHEVYVYTASFPSGHAMLSAVTYLTLAALLTREESSPRVRAYLLAVAIGLSLLVGISRVYLGVHWPTDVLAGWAVGAAWALVCVLIANRFDPRPQG